jgi:hypothetical protein
MSRNALAKDPEAGGRNASKNCFGAVSTFKKGKPEQQRKLMTRMFHAAGDKTLSAVEGRIGHDVIG